MIRRQMGQSGISIAPLMLGGNVFGWTADQSTSFAILDRFVDAGLDAIDTADIYSVWVPGHVGGESETVIGQWLRARGHRDRVVIATKVGSSSISRPGKLHFTLSAQHIVRSIEQSLTRLQTDYIDLYQAHGDDPETPLDETLEAFERLIRAGKVRAVGTSHICAERLDQALDLSDTIAVARLNTMQPRFSLCERGEYEGAVQDLCVRRSVGALCYSSLAKGFLTGKFRSEKDIAGNVYADFLKPHLTARGLGIVRALEDVANRHASTCAAVAIAWLLAQPGVCAAIAAVDTPGQLDEITGAVALSLTSDDIGALTQASES